MSISSIQSSITSSCSCQNCGMTTLVETGFSAEARKRIEELEEQVKEHSLRAAIAADKLATSQDEFRKFRDGNKNSTQASSQPPSSPPRAAVGRITAFLNGRSSPSGSNASGSATPPAGRPASSGGPSSEEASKQASAVHASVAELERQLGRERAQREEAEKQLAKVTNELEELSASLFQQANEMVSTERRARAKLEERVAQLEKRDMDKEMRLETLEKALERINRVRGILSERKSQ